MDHNFTPSQLDSTKCAKCKHEEIDHTNRATCEVCGNSGTVTEWTGMLLCMDCLEKEKVALLEHQSPAKQEERVNNHNRLLEQHNNALGKINARTDVFNAEPVPFSVMFEAIDNEPTVVNKQFEKCRVLKATFDHLSKVIFSARETLQKAVEEQKLIQHDLITRANALREDERKKLQLFDIEYKPGVIKVKTTSSKKPSEKKWTKSDVREMAAEYKVPVDAVQMICVARNMHPKDAAMMLAKQIHGE